MGKQSVKLGGLESERYAFLVEESGVVISTHRPGDWAFTSINARFHDVLGYRIEDLIGVPVYFFFHPDDSEAMKQRTIPSIHADGTRTFRYRYLHKDGHYLWLESTHRSIRDSESGELKEIIAVSRDLTSQLKAEMTSRQLAMVAESSTDLVLFCDRSFNISYMNGSASKALGLEGGNYPPLLQLLSKASCKRLCHRVKQVTDENRSWLGHLEVELLTCRDLQVELQEVQLHGQGILEPEDDFYGLIFRDLTAQRQAEKLERERQQELALAARLMTMGEMATGLAHEINQPLATIINYSRGALRRINTGKLSCLDEMKPVLESVSHQAQRAADIIKRLRSLVKKTPYQRLRFNVNDTCRGVVEFLQYEWIQSGIEVELSLQKPLADINADAIQIEQVLINLLRNGIEAYSGLRDNKKRVEIFTEQRSASVVVRVVDYAGGISSERQAQVFEPYYSTKKSGLGMGLSICRSIVEAHSGQIRLESNGQTYSSFEISIPAVVE